MNSPPVLTSSDSLEAAQAVGGRVRTDMRDAFLRLGCCGSMNHRGVDPDQGAGAGLAPPVLLPTEQFIDRKHTIANMAHTAIARELTRYRNASHHRGPTAVGSGTSPRRRKRIRMRHQPASRADSLQ